ncbi:7TM diverse intracellular signaling domain-containing protein [Hydrogenophaga sp. PBL-H3]|uniref:7TM diverse intracellular signaling domain-containing protein n=1 Tax=Hydrogenophaga sp. PBL-H3 TaxID=434010 RepID=UPI00135A9DE1|nr:7TM diverse intracellular signaling domain-containing protein [Hydrogenophaga sp. PBL-H3]
MVMDAKANLTVDEVLALARNGLAKKLDQGVFSPGYSSAAYWFVVSLENGGSQPLERLLVFNPIWLDDLQATLVASNGAAQSAAGGDSVPFSQRAEAFRRVNFSLTVPPGGATLVVRAATSDPFFIGMELLDRDAFERLAASEALYFGLLYGGLLSLLLFNLMLFLTSREKTYLAYCVWLAAFLVMHATYNGHTFRWVMPESPQLYAWFSSIVIYVYSFFGLVFALVFLDLKNKLPAAHVWTLRLLAVLVLSFFVTMLGGYRAHVISAIAWVVIFGLGAFTLGWLSLQRRNKAAALYLCASTAGLVGSTFTALTVMSVLPFSEWTFRAVDIGILIDAIMLSLALSARIAQVQRLERLRRFFSPAVADKLLSATSEELYQPRHREIVVLFLDLRGYTAFTVKHGAEEVMRILGEFHAAMGKLVIEHEATLERFAGDGMMIFFNDPVEVSDPAKRAVVMAMQMQADFSRLNEIWGQRGYSLAMGIGIAQGMATIGAIGFEGRRDYAAIGNVTNLAARLCADAHAGQILVSSVVAREIEDEMPVTSVGALSLKGFSEPVPCYEVPQPSRNPAAQASGSSPQSMPDLHVEGC